MCGLCFADELDTKLEKLLYPCVRVLSGGRGGSGTVLLSKKENKKFKTFVLTNHHVVENLIRVEKKWDNLTHQYYNEEDNDLATVELFSYINGGMTVTQTPVKAEIIAYNKDEDLALLMLKHPFEVKYTATILPEDKKLKLFQEIFAVGCQQLADPFPTDGIISDLEVIIDKKSYIASSAPIYFGSSGGSVHVKVDNQYYFVGIPSRVSGGHGQILNHMGYFIRPERIHKFIDENKLYFLTDSSKTIKECMEERAKLRDKFRQPSKEY
jgi:S1-C subfamily serine protease